MPETPRKKAKVVMTGRSQKQNKEIDNDANHDVSRKEKRLLLLPLLPS
jgi:hypothetical protein